MNNGWNEHGKLGQVSPRHPAPPGPGAASWESLSGVLREEKLAWQRGEEGKAFYPQPPIYARALSEDKTWDTTPRNSS